MTRCNSELIFHSLQGELSATQQSRLERHLAECERCREEKFDFKLTLLAIKNSEGSFTHPALTRRIESALEAERNRRRIPILRFISGAAAAAAVITFFVLFTHRDLQEIKNGAGEPIAQLRSLQEANGSWGGEVGATAMVTLALLENESSQKTAQDRTRIDQAMHFLTREKNASAVEELLRCSALLAEKELSGTKAAPQLQMALQNAFSKVNGSQDPFVIPLLKQVVERGHRLQLETRQGDQLLSQMTLARGEKVLERADWKDLSKHLIQKENNSPSAEPLLLASSFLSKSF